MYFARGPMWMLVNTTIFAEFSELEVMIDTMISTLEGLVGEHCQDTDVPTSEPNTEPNCEWEEYTETKEYLLKERITPI